jgi:predicted phosphodiesterase
MRLAVLSDIHGNAAALEAVLADLHQHGGADKHWILGDLCAFGPRPRECLDIIRGLKNTDVIGGNTDRYLVTGERPRHRVESESGFATLASEMVERETNFSWTLSVLSFKDYEYLSKLRPELDVHVPGYGWVVGFHGAPGSDERQLLPDTPDEELLDQMLDRDGRLGFGGHTHIPMDRSVGAWRVVNVGSVGMPRGDQRACYALATFDKDSVTIALRQVVYDVSAVVEDIKSKHAAWQWFAGRIQEQPTTQPGA